SGETTRIRSQSQQVIRSPEILRIDINGSPSFERGSETHEPVVCRISCAGGSQEVAPWRTRRTPFLSARNYIMTFRLTKIFRLLGQNDCTPTVTCRLKTKHFLALFGKKGYLLLPRLMLRGGGTFSPRRCLCRRSSWSIAR